MKRTILLAIMIAMLSGVAGISQESKKIYNPEADAKQEIRDAVKKAKAEGKHVLVQVGGNWCGWCLLFHKFINEDAEITKFLNEHYVFVLLNYSKENPNKEILAGYGNPGRLGYPVFLILDGKGNLVHTQDSGLLEEGKGYNKSKVLGFMRNWTVAAVDPKNMK